MFKTAKDVLKPHGKLELLEGRPPNKPMNVLVTFVDGLFEETTEVSELGDYLQQLERYERLQVEMLGGNEFDPRLVHELNYLTRCASFRYSSPCPPSLQFREGGSEGVELASYREGSLSSHVGIRYLGLHKKVHKTRTWGYLGSL